MRRTTQHLFAWESYAPGTKWAFAEEVQGLSPLQKQLLREGGRVVKRSRTIEVQQFSRGPSADVVGTVFMGVLVSQKLRQVLEEATPEWVRFLPVQSRHGRFYFLNLLSILDCIDFEKSRLKLLPGDRPVISSVRSLVLKNLPSDVPPLFHVKELPGLFVVTRELRTLLEDACEAPGDFIPIKDYRRGL